MERINFSKNSEISMYLFLIVGILSLAYAVFRIFKSISNGAGLFTGHHHIMAFLGLITQIIFGFIFIFLWYTNSKYRKYYIEWDNEKMRYRLPSSPQTQTITLGKITRADIQSRKLELLFNDTTTKTIDLEGIDYDDLQKIRDSFIK
ncbi:MAG TPA: hypothetical protein VE912_00585 [Bacteroidales bacterium]|nr:hypothetical protein [Bacteroidales bacterium]